ncbi:PREDICTED: leucine-rich repeat-containing protein 37B-like [Chrysochloris asiatica]|uniref:Leucine-rich repeat-containing protein 37B-like n=1 Tax=Chrysochloris asiatica TaxID=185453 RepID=A0A9B0X2Y2_CHRAS|nr:PREDICTED: leucine-rich repeat-containing protein 37B-like [Chrysochloris asiatica]
MELTSELIKVSQHQRFIGLGLCTQEPPLVMAQQCLWSLRLLLELRVNPFGCWSWLSRFQKGSDYMDPPAPAQMLAPPQELTETLDMDSATEPPPMPDQFAGTHQDLNDQLTPHQKLPEVGPVLDWDQNQALALPPQLKSKTEPPGMSQAEGHQSFEILVPSLDSHSSRATKFIVSPPNLKKDLAHQAPEPPEEVRFEPTLPSDVEGPELPEEEEPSVQQEPPQAMKPFVAHQEVPNLPPEPTTEMEPFLLQQEGPAETLQTIEEVKPPVPEEVPSKPSEPPHKVEPSSVQQETPFQTPEVLEESEPSLTEQEAQTQSLQPPEVVTTPSSVHHEMTLQPTGQNQIHHSTLPKVTIKSVDVELTLTQEPTKEVQSCPTQQEVTAPSQMPSEEIESFPVHQEVPAHPLKPNEEVEPSPVQQEASAQPLKASPGQLEAPAHPPKPSVEEEASVQASPVQQGGAYQPVKLPEEVEPSPVQQEAPTQPHLSNLPNVTVKPADLQLTLTPEPTKEVKPPTHQEDLAQPPEPPNVVLTLPSLRDISTSRSSTNSAFSLASNIS